MRADPSGSGARVAFEVSAEMRARVERAVAAVRGAPGERASRRELIGVVVELTGAGLDYYFLYPLELAGVGAVSRGTARLGVAAARRGIPGVVRRVVGSMAEDELLAIADFLERIVIPAD